ncbi:MAG: hypothetical protein M0C28_22730 [Candidatus Moduliflexus flocculans]|nr:hypothetical protein [Candidatus Moduliflexus flocculans]
MRFSDAAYDPRYRTKLLVAHHDRRPGSSGALDNGAACLQLADLAGRLAAEERVRTTRRSSSPIRRNPPAPADSGLLLRRPRPGGPGSRPGGEGEEPPAVFVFDVTGRGAAAHPVHHRPGPPGLPGAGLAETLAGADTGPWTPGQDRALRRAPGDRAPLRLARALVRRAGLRPGRRFPPSPSPSSPGPSWSRYRASVRSCAPGGRTRIPTPGTGSTRRSMPATWARLHGPGRPPRDRAGGGVLRTRVPDPGRLPGN